MGRLLDAVHFMHLNGVVHRDLKLENLILAEKLKLQRRRRRRRRRRTTHDDDNNNGSSGGSGEATATAATATEPSCWRAW